MADHGHDDEDYLHDPDVHDDDGGEDDVGDDDIVDHNPEDPRTLLGVKYTKFRPHSHRVSAFITSKFSLQTCTEGHSWKTVTDAQLEWYWDHFVANYKWDPTIDLLVRACWRKTIGDLYRKTVHGWRKSGRKSGCISADTWAAWQAIWASPGWKACAVTYKKNRHKEPAGPGTGMTKHTAGSRSFIEHSDMMCRDLGREPTGWEVFNKTHTTKDGTFVDERSRAIDAAMRSRVDAMSQPSSSSSPHRPLTSTDINYLYFEVIGGSSKGRVYGLGSQAAAIFPSATGPHRRGAGASAAVSRERLDAALEAARAATEEARVAREESRIVREEASQERSRMNNQCTDLQSQITSLQDQVRMLVSSIAQRDYMPTSSTRRASTPAQPRAPSRRHPSQSYVHGTYGDGDDDEETGDDETQDPNV